ncbi:replication initiation protein [Lachnospiraceae bacterium 50-23]
MKDSLVVKANQLIEARYDLSLNEQKIILYAASKIDREKDYLNYIELDISEFMELLETKGKRYEEIRDITRELRKKEVVINTNDTEYIAGWISSITFYKNTGKIKLRFDDDLMPYLLQLKKRFTRYQLKNILYLKGKYSIRIYELLKQYEGIGKREFKLQELKKILFIENCYDRIYDLERFILIPAVDEINEHTDIIIDYEKIKTGRRVTSIFFKVTPKDQSDKVYIEYLNEFYDIQEMKSKMGLEAENFNQKQIMEIYNKAVEKVGNEDIDIFEYIRFNYLYAKSKARNKYGYLLDALDNDYAVAVGQLTLLDKFGN